MTAEYRGGNSPSAGLALAMTIAAVAFALLGLMAGKAPGRILLHLVGFGTLVVLCLGILRVIFLARTEPEIWPYRARPVLSDTELLLYARLVKALPNYMVLGQVALSRVLRVKEGYPFAPWHNRISRMSLDFVVCRRDGTCVAAIECDDASHERADRKLADAKKDRALEAAGIRIIRWNVKALPGVDDIAREFVKVLPCAQPGGTVETGERIPPTLR